MVALLFILTIIGLIYGIGGNIANKYSKVRSEEFERARAAGNVRNQRGPSVYDFKFTKGISTISTFAFVSFIVFWTFIVKIDGQSVGVITTPSGVKTEAYHTGWHFILPWWEVHNMDKTVWVYTCAKSKKEGEKN